MKTLTPLPLSAALIAGLAAGPALAQFSITPYGSLRIQAEAVTVDEAQPGEEDSYEGLRDAYSRLGVTANYVMSDELSFAATVELPVNSARLIAEDPTFFQGFYKDDNRPRVATVAASHADFGSLTFGTQWLPYYNNVAYPVDFFSSFYSGYATYANFRRDALTYVSPTVGGVTLTVAGVDTIHHQGTEYLDTMQYALSWANDSFTAAIAYQDSVDEAADLIGISGSYVVGPWRFAAKVEQFISEDSVQQGEDPVVFNLYASYTHNQFTYKAMYAQGDDNTDESSAFFIGESIHLGVDYQHSDALKFFAEYFYEEYGYAIYTPNSRSFDPLAGFQNQTDGHALAVGLRFDF